MNFPLLIIWLAIFALFLPARIAVVGLWPRCNTGHCEDAYVFIAVDFALGIFGFSISRPGELRKLGLRLFRKTIYAITIRREEPKFGEHDEKKSDLLRFIWKNRRYLFQGVHNMRKPLFGARLMAHLKVGFDNPALTGEVTGYLWAISGALSPWFQMELQPVFFNPGISGRVKGSLWLFPAALVFTVVLMMLHLSIRYFPFRRGAIEPLVEKS